MTPMLPKSVILVAPTSFTNGATAGGTATTQLVDTKGFKYVRFRLHATSAAATEIPSVLKVQEADANATTSLSNVTGYVGGTDFTIPAPYTNSTLATAAEYAQICVPLQGRKRYLTLVCSPVTTQTIRIEADLLRADQAPDTAAEANVALAFG